MLNLLLIYICIPTAVSKLQCVNYVSIQKAYLMSLSLTHQSINIFKKRKLCHYLIKVEIGACIFLLTSLLCPVLIPSTVLKV